jgi:hypothetical protein
LAEIAAVAKLPQVQATPLATAPQAMSTKVTFQDQTFITEWQVRS